MATREELAGVTTYLSPKELKEVIEAIDNGQAKEVPGSGSVFAGSSGCEFDYNGARYEIAEVFESLVSVHLVRSEQQKLDL